MIMVDISGRDDGIRGGFQESIRAREKLGGGMTWAKWGAVIWPKKISRNFRGKKRKKKQRMWNWWGRTRFQKKIKTLWILGVTEDVFTGRNYKHVLQILVGNILEVSWKTVFYHLRIKNRRDMSFLLSCYLNVALNLHRGWRQLLWHIYQEGMKNLAGVHHESILVDWTRSVMSIDNNWRQWKFENFPI